MTEPIPNLTHILTTLNEIGASINRLASTYDLAQTLDMIVSGAVRVVGVGQEMAGPPAGASAVIWIYDAVTGTFDRDSRVSAGEPEGTSPDDFPRPEGLGREVVRRKQRLLSYELPKLSIHPAKQAAGARVMACYPLQVEAEVVGLLYVYRCDTNHFSEIELLLLDHFVQLASLAIYHGRKVGGLNRALNRKIHELEKLNWASQLIGSRSNLAETLQAILSIGLEMTAAQYGSFEWYDQERNLLVSKALAGGRERPASEPPLPLNEESVVGWVASRREALLIEDLHEEQWQAIYKPLFIHQEMRSELAVPVLGASGELKGVLNIESPRPRAFTPDDRRLLEALATQAALAIQETRLLDLLPEITQAVMATGENELFKLIIDRACELIQVSAGFIWTLSEAGNLILRQSTAGLQVEEHPLAEDDFAHRAIRLRLPVTIDDARSEAGFRYQALAREQGWVSAIVVPLLALSNHQRPVGVFTLFAPRLRDFSDWDKKLLTYLANHAAIAIHNTEQLAQLKQAQERQVLAETFAAVGDIGANLLHQLNNRMGAILLRAQAIEAKCGEALETWPYLAAGVDEIRAGIQEAIKIVQDSMIHLQPASPQLVEIEPCLQRALQQATPAPTVKVSQINLTGLPRAWASEKQLEMVFYNLIDNALRAMGQRGELILKGEDHGRELAITVQDTGPGIPPDQHQKIFEFVPRVTLSKTAPSGRLGFGLWWVKTFVDRFGGRVTLRSEPGQGSTFTIWLPAEKRQDGG